MSVEKVRDYFRQWNMEDRIKEFDVSSATVELASLAIGCDPKQIAKTLDFKVKEKPILIVASGDARVDNKKYKAQFSVRPKMLSPQELIEMVGYAAGSVCPFAVKDGVTVYLDESLKRFEKVFPASGSSNSIIELTIEELEKCSKYVAWIDVCNGWE
ncbi:MAG TPA: EBSC protein [Ruminiclostridium sp.]|nr:EBSC protein [Ruminiclostridium sp.]